MVYENAKDRGNSPVGGMMTSRAKVSQKGEACNNEDDSGDYNN